MHPFTTATLAVTAKRLDHAIATLEEYAETCGEGVRDPKGLFARGYGELYRLRSLIQDVSRLEQTYERLLEEVDTGRSSAMVIR